MQRTPARALPLAVCFAAAFLATACSVFDPAGNGGWSPERRNQELARAGRLATPPAPSAPTQPDGAASGAPEVTAQPDVRTLDLATALELAARRNRTIAASAASLDAAAGSVAVARAPLLPTNSVRGAYNWYSDEQTSSVDIDPAIFPPGTTLPVVTVREQDFFTVNAAVRLALDVSGELRHGLGAAQASYRAESARNWATRLEQETAVAAAYFGFLEAQRLREVGTQTIALHQQQFDDASTRFEQGRITRNGVLVVQVALTDARQAVMRLDNAVASARRSLNGVTGLDIGAPTVVRDVARRPDLPALDQCLASASANNPLVSAMLEDVHAADERLTAVRRSRFPRFSAQAGYDATTSETLAPNNYASVGVGVDFDLGSFGREGEIARLEATSRRSRLLLDRTVRDVEALVRDSFDRVHERLAAIDAQAEAVTQAEENVRIRRVQFDEGRATSEDLLDASQLLTRQRAAFAAAVYQAHARRAELQQLMGEPLAALSDVTGPPAPEPSAKPAHEIRPGEPRR